MADPVSAIGLSLAVLTTFKEAYLLSKYMWRTIQSAKHHKSERFLLETEYRHELLYLCSLGRLHQKHAIFFADEVLQKAWLEHMRDVFECLSSEVFGQYAKLAAKEDPDYQEYSPFLNRAAAQSWTIDFSLAIEDDLVVAREKPLPDESSWDS
ncbi:MAG: hypothetical protein FRX48_03848 [Lasallia pustulata]|uniref:Uncharacterized protein n=1 Tax=Lasallia pustulata TaxID=136370 RepID=A0A5M8PV50_9LECA|nr:MAG: hypothetical protein FRX48_03848 [Lasallia pustulata]